MRKLILCAVLMVLLAPPSGAQLVQTFTYAHLYDNGTLHLVIDPGDAGGASATLEAAVILRRYGVWDRDPAKALPDWFGYSGIDADGRVRYYTCGTSPSRPDSQVFDFTIDDHVNLPYTFGISYRLSSGGVKGDWFYADATRVTDPVADPTGTMVFDAINCINDRITVTGTVTVSPASVRMELWDSVGLVWVPLTNVALGDWSDTAWGGVFVGTFLPPTTEVTTDGSTRFYLLTKDGVEHGPVDGPNIVSISCDNIVVSLGGGEMELFDSMMIAQVVCAGRQQHSCLHD